MPPSCCPEGAWPPILKGAQHEEQGRWVTHAGTESYVVQHGPGCGAGLIVIPDVFGVRSGRHRAICDQLAQALPGLLVTMPDLFQGEEMADAPECDGISCGLICRAACRMVCCCKLCGLGQWSWANKQRELYMEQSLPYLRAQGAIRFGVLGFCFGSYAVFHASGTGQFRCGVSFHPAVEALCRTLADDEDHLDLCSQVRCPQLVVHTDGDHHSWLPREEANRAANEAVNGNVWLATDQKHGFMSRGDIALPATRIAVEEHFEILIEFLKKHLLQSEALDEHGDERQGESDAHVNQI